MFSWLKELRRDRAVAHLIKSTTYPGTPVISIPVSPFQSLSILESPSICVHHAYKISMLRPDFVKLTVMPVEAALPYSYCPLCPNAFLGPDRGNASSAISCGLITSVTQSEGATRKQIRRNHHHPSFKIAPTKLSTITGVSKYSTEGSDPYLYTMNLFHSSV